MKYIMLIAALALLVGATFVLAGNGVAPVTPRATTSVSFAKAITLNSPVLYPKSLAAGDVNHDGIPDLAVVGDEEPALLHAFGKGDGHFGHWSHKGGTGDAPNFVLFADMDLDGNLDAITTDDRQSFLVVAFGDGKGNFNRGGAVHTHFGYATIQVAVADLNGDGIPDIVGTSPGRIFVFLGAGNRRFRKPIHFSSGGRQTFGIAVGDLNHDGIPDLAVANWGGNLAVLLGKGDGTFDKPVTYYAGIHPTELVLADLNGDGNLDVSVAGDVDVRVFLGKGDGTLSSPQIYHPGKYPDWIVSADFNGDGIPDLAVSNYTNPKPCHVSVLLGNGDGTFQPPVQFRVGISPTQLVVADFNHDGEPDIATINAGSSTISILLNTTQFPAPAPH
jgi:hypothetical protein